MKFMLHLVPCLISCCLYAQVNNPDPAQGGISGYVLDIQTKEPLISANVVVVGTTRGTVTNKSGYFVIPEVSTGNITIHISMVGYEGRDTILAVQPQKFTSLKIELKETALILSEVVVGGTITEDAKNSISTISLPVADLQRLPAIGESDLIRALQLLPGVQASSEISTGLYIRGGSPDQNLILLDGITVYNPSHLFGFFSTFNSDAIKDVKLIKGGYPAEYGGRLSAVLDVTNKDGNRNEFSAAGSTSLISSKLLLEGPLGKGSYMLSGRRTYFDLILMAANLKDLPNYYFYDLNAKVNIDELEKDKFSFSVYKGDDALDYSFKEQNVKTQSINITWGNQTFSGKWTHLFSDQLYSNLIVAGSQFKSITKAGFTGFDVLFDNRITDISIKPDLEWYPSSEHIFKFGLWGTYYRFSYNNKVGENTGFSNDVVTHSKYFASYLQDQWKPAISWTITSGLRYNFYSLGNRHYLEPRFQARYQIDDRWALIGSCGYYTQYTTLVAREGASFADLWFPIDKSIKPQEAIQYIAGVHYQSEGYSVELEGYYKPMKELTEFNMDAKLNESQLSNIFFIGEGLARGIELFIQKKIGKLTGWIGYTLSRTTRTFEKINNGKEYPTKWDFTHYLALTGNYDLGASWSLGSTFVYRSGTAYTVPTGTYQIDFADNSYLYLRSGKKNAHRLEPYHRLDVSLSKAWKGWGGDWRLSINIYNIYSHRNVWYRNYAYEDNGTPEITDIRLLPIVPTLELSFKF